MAAERTNFELGCSDLNFELRQVLAFTFLSPVSYIDIGYIDLAGLSE